MPFSEYVCCTRPNSPTHTTNKAEIIDKRDPQSSVYQSAKVQTGENKNKHRPTTDISPPPTSSTFIIKFGPLDDKNTKTTILSQAPTPAHSPINTATILSTRPTFSTSLSSGVYQHKTADPLQQTLTSEPHSSTYIPSAEVRKRAAAHPVYQKVLSFLQDIKIEIKQRERSVIASCLPFTTREAQRAQFIAKCELPPLEEVQTEVKALQNRIYETYRTSATPSSEEIEQWKLNLEKSRKDLEAFYIYSNNIYRGLNEYFEKARKLEELIFHLQEVINDTIAKLTLATSKLELYRTHAIDIQSEIIRNRNFDPKQYDAQLKTLTDIYEQLAKNLQSLLNSKLVSQNSLSVLRIMNSIPEEIEEPDSSRLTP